MDLCVLENNSLLWVTALSRQAILVLSFDILTYLTEKWEHLFDVTERRVCRSFMMMILIGRMLCMIYTRNRAHDWFHCIHIESQKFAFRKVSCYWFYTVKRQLQDLSGFYYNLSHPYRWESNLMFKFVGSIIYCAIARYRNRASVFVAFQKPKITVAVHVLYFSRSSRDTEVIGNLKNLCCFAIYHEVFVVGSDFRNYLHINRNTNTQLKWKSSPTLKSYVNCSVSRTVRL